MVGRTGACRRAKCRLARTSPSPTARGRALYAAYQKRLKELNAVDFGDLLLEGLRLLREHPDVLADYQRRFRYHAGGRVPGHQRRAVSWLRLLAQGSTRPTCAASATTTSRSTAGAGPRSRTSCGSRRIFRAPRSIRLERNYRSTGHILGAASGLIAHNRGRLGKTLQTEIDLGDKVTVTGVWDDEEEARTSASASSNAARGQPLNEVAILMRASFQMRAFEDRFVTLGPAVPRDRRATVL